VNEQAAQAQHEKEVASHTRKYTELYGVFDEERKEQSKNIDGLEAQLAQVEPLTTLLSFASVLSVVLCTTWLAAQCYVCQTKRWLFLSLALVLATLLPRNCANPLFCLKLSACPC